MNKFIPLIIICLLTYFCFQCREDDTNNRATSSISKTYKKDVYVLFDYSKSLDTNSINITAQNAYKLVKNCPKERILKFIPINNDPFAKVIFEYSLPSKPSKPKQVNLWKLDRTKSAAKIADKIVELHNTSNVNSCIVNSFSTVYNHVKNTSGEIENELIILSDFLECCSGLPCAESIKGFNKLNSKINKYNLVQTPINNYLRFENIYLVLNSSSNPKVKPIYSKTNGGNFYSFWNGISKELGYSKGFENRMIPNLPNWAR